MRLKDKVVIITGAAQGIGEAFALGYAKEGAKIVVADILDGKNTVDAIDRSGGQAIYIRTDVTKQEQCNAMARAAFDRFGSIDILVNNAAIFGDVILKPFMEVTTEEWNRLMEVNTTGTFHCIKAVFPYMKEKGGKIINMASGSILEGVPGMPHYVASKGAIMALTRCMARELGDFSIRVNSIAPGFTHSPGGDKFDQNKTLPIGPLENLDLPRKCLKRPSYPKDLVGTAVFLASDESGLITGQMIVHNAGTAFH